jgi:hypothetical protein
VKEEKKSQLYFDACINKEPDPPTDDRFVLQNDNNHLQNIIEELKT